jgi:hypothetical protein
VQRDNEAKARRVPVDVPVAERTQPCIAKGIAPPERRVDRGVGRCGKPFRCHRGTSGEGSRTGCQTPGSDRCDPRSCEWMCVRRPLQTRRRDDHHWRGRDNRPEREKRSMRRGKPEPELRPQGQALITRFNPRQTSTDSRAARHRLDQRTPVRRQNCDGSRPVQRARVAICRWLSQAPYQSRDTERRIRKRFVFNESEGDGGDTERARAPGGWVPGDSMAAPARAGVTSCRGRSWWKEASRVGRSVVCVERGASGPEARGIRAWGGAATPQVGS